MAKNPNEDLFADSTMSFGEHLEELRSALSKALIGLLIGFLIGLSVANYVVQWIQSPLKTALEDHYIDRSVEELVKKYKKEGQNISPQIEAFVREKRFVFENVYVESGELTRVESLLDEAVRPRRKTASDNPPSETEPPSGETTDGSADATPAASSETILGADVPSPQPPLIATRVWRPINTVIEALNAHEAFMIWLKAAFVAGLVISSPYIFWHLWLFVAAGLYPHEKNYVYIYLPFSILLFLAGAGTAFFFVFEHVLRFLFSFNKAMNIDIAPRISEWLSFVLFLPLGFGIAFQLPLVMLFLHRIGIFSIAIYLDKWRIAVLVIFVISMLLTPADPISMLLMATPLTVLYFLGIILCKWMPRNRNPFGEVYEP